MARPPSNDPPRIPGGLIEEDSSYDDDDSEDVVTRLHVMPSQGETGPYPGAVVSGKYLLKKQIARGGMGSVWQAMDVGLERPVAIKFMDPRIAEDEDLRKRFGREAKAAARLRTPHVVQIYEAGIEGGLPYIAMELLEGEDLHARLKRDVPMPLGEVAEIVSQIARGLRSAQDAKVIHRDLKPQNIFLSNEGGGLLVKILDFGVAKIRAAADKGDETKAGTVLGSPHYMSPEQARGRPDIDHRADVWSLGVIAFRAITGRMAFPGEAPGEVILKICTDPIPVPSKYRADLPAAMDEVFAKVLDRTPETRYQSALDFAAALERVARLAGPAMAPGQPRADAQAPYGVAGPAAPMYGHPAAPGSPAPQWGPGSLAARAVPQQGPAAGMPAPAMAQQLPAQMPGGTPASAVQAMEPPPSGTPSSAVHSTDQVPFDGTPSSAVQAMDLSPELPSDPNVRRGGSAAPPGTPAGPYDSSANVTGPDGTPLPASQPAVPPTAAGATPTGATPTGATPAGEQPPISADFAPLVPATVPPQPTSDSGDAWPQPAVATADDSGQYSPAHPYAAVGTGMADTPAPGIGGAVAPPDLWIEDDDVLVPKRGFAMIGGVVAGAAVLVLIASVLLLGRPDETTEESNTAPIPSTLLEDLPPTEPDDLSPPPPPYASEAPPAKSAAPSPTGTSEDDTSTSSTSATSTSSAKDKPDKPPRPRYPRRPPPDDDWGY